MVILPGCHPSLILRIFPSSAFFPGSLPVLAQGPVLQSLLAPVLQWSVVIPVVVGFGLCVT
eukprot:11756666-Prorocentrum_lima.AAC.1